MALPQPVFDDLGNLTPKARKVLKEILQAQELSRFMDLVGYTPNPNGPYPRPWPWPGPWPYTYRNPAELQAVGFLGGVSYPNPDDDGPWPWPIGLLVKELMSDVLLDKIANASTKKGSLNIIDAIKREGVAKEAFSELSTHVNDFQKSLVKKAKASA